MLESHIPLNFLISMEGPSLFLAKEQLKPFKKKVVLSVSGNTTMEKSRLEGQCSGPGEIRYRRLQKIPRNEARPHVRERTDRDVQLLRKIIEHPRLKTTYDFAADIMSPAWDSALAYGKMKKFPGEEIGDVLLDQGILGGVGNIINNEILSLARIHAENKVRDLSPQGRKKILTLARSFSIQQGSQR